MMQWVSSTRTEFIRAHLCLRQQNVAEVSEHLSLLYDVQQPGCRRGRLPPHQESHPRFDSRSAGGFWKTGVCGYKALAEAAGKVAEVGDQEVAVVVCEVVARGEQRVKVLPERERCHNLLGSAYRVEQATAIWRPACMHTLRRLVLYPAVLMACVIKLLCILIILCQCYLLALSAAEL
jgi:hypothetical protein